MTADKPYQITAATAYNAADPVSQELSSWHPQLKSPDAAYLPERDKITSRINDLVRNDGWASGSVTRFIDSVIGSSLRLSSKPDFRMLGIKPEEAVELSKYFEAEWRSFGYDIDRYCDAARHHTIGGLFALGFRHKFVDGDAIAIAHHLPERGGRYATTIQIINPDRLCNENGAPNNDTLRGGVEIDEYGAAVNYYFRNAHVTEQYKAEDFNWTKVARETDWGRPLVIHDYNKEKAGQTRGVGKLTPIVERLKMLTNMDRVELQAAVINATLATYITSPFDHAMVQGAMEANDEELAAYQSGRIDFHKDAQLQLNGARVPILFPGEDIKGLDSKRPSTAYADFEAQALRNIAAGIGMSYEQISTDWSKTNYSSARAALLEVWRTFNKEREDFSQSFCTRIYSVFLEELFDRGDVPLPSKAPDFYEAKTAYCRSRWIGPPRGWVDPVKEAQAAVIRIERGLSTLEDECAEQGKDFEEVIAQRKVENTMWQEADLPDPTIVNIGNSGESNDRN